MASQRQAAGDDAGTCPLWFSPPDGEENRRRVVTRDRVVAEALAIISASGAAALSMRALATRLGVVPAGLPAREAALAFRLIHDYTIGFALSDPTTPGGQRVQGTATRREMHAFLRSLPASRFPALTALGAYAWAGDRDQRFTASLDTLIAGLRGQPSAPAPTTPPIQLKRDLPGQPAQIAGREHPRHHRDRPGDRHDGSTDSRLNAQRTSS